MAEAVHVPIRLIQANGRKVDAVKVGGAWRTDNYFIVPCVPLAEGEHAGIKARLPV